MRREQKQIPSVSSEPSISQWKTNVGFIFLGSEDISLGSEWFLLGSKHILFWVVTMFL